MSTITFSGLATGLDTDSIVEGLMAVENAAVESLEKDQEYEALKLKAYKEFDDKLEAFRTAVSDLNLTNEVRLTKTKLNSEDTISASSDGAQLGSYDISVVQLAQVQKDIGAGFSSSTESVLGSGSITIGGEVITIGSDNNSLQGLMESINALSGETGVTATLLNDGSDSENYHLVFSGVDASSSFEISSSLVDSSGYAVDFTTTRVRDAQQAIAYVDGLEVVGNSNTLSGVISGVTLNLNEVSEIVTAATDDEPAEYATTTLTIEADTDTLKEKITTFVSAYNGIMEWISSAYDEDQFDVDSTTDTDDPDDDDESDEDTTTLAYILRGDSSINSIKRSLQSTLSSASNNSGSLQILSQIGLSTQYDGTLYMNSSKVDEALSENFEDVVKLFAGDGTVDGVMKELNTYMLEVTSSADGIYATKSDSYDEKMEDLDDQITRKEYLLEKVEERIRAQFSAMELLVSELNSIGDYLTQTFKSSSS
ncbi:flagellar filament capping protein FliD [Desulforhopalus sp. IMCC35007]|uniref:flagellar filament capping protein FliD n=1 Tax=Desulforhopalus sp. IMCC35007 TaxID=2569543 RepID=UPI0010AE83AB|nr:flagellar filament capping protein FliD [Desulforhopalus sp. IMCC35007]TKB10259.1 flagellar hook-associated protein 2 [Desulforhopalus sp. IMCC35007]